MEQDLLNDVMNNVLPLLYRRIARNHQSKSRPCSFHTEEGVL